MKLKLNQVTRNQLIAAILLAGGVAQADIPAAAATALADALATALLGVAAGGAAFLTFRSSGVIWSLIAGFVSKMRRA